MQEVFQSITKSLDDALGQVRNLQGELQDPFVRGWMSRTYDQINDARQAIDALMKLQPLLRQFDALEYAEGAYESADPDWRNWASMN